jgi:hypothetical protein
MEQGDAFFEAEAGCAGIQQLHDFNTGQMPAIQFDPEIVSGRFNHPAHEFEGGGEVLGAPDGHAFGSCLNGQAADVQTFIRSQRQSVQGEAHRPFVGGLDEIAEFAQQDRGVAIADASGVDGDFEDLRTVVDGGLNFVTPDVCVRSSEGKANGAGDQGAGILEARRGLGDAGAIDAHAEEAVFACFGAELIDLDRGGVAVAAGVIEDARQFMTREGADGWR